MLTFWKVLVIATAIVFKKNSAALNLNAMSFAIFSHLMIFNSKLKVGKGHTCINEL